MLGVACLVNRVSVLVTDNKALDFVDSKGTEYKALLSKDIINIDGKEISIYFDIAER